MLDAERDALVSGLEPDRRPMGAEALIADARVAALQGSAVLREHLRSLSRPARDLLRGEVGTAEEPGPLLEAAQRVDNEPPAGIPSTAAPPGQEDSRGQAGTAPVDAAAAPAGEPQA